MSALDQLASDDLFVSCAPIATADALYAILARRDEVGRLRKEISDGTITGDLLKQYVGDLLGAFRRGTRLPGELSLCAVAAALAAVPTDFAHAFLNELSAVRVAELPMAGRIAELAARDQRFIFGQRDSRLFHLGGNVGSADVKSLVGNDVTHANSENTPTATLDWRRLRVA